MCARRSIDKQGKPVTVETNGRHDPCVGIRATPIAEADDGAGAHGPCFAPPRTERRCDDEDSEDPCFSQENVSFSSNLPVLPRSIPIRMKLSPHYS